MRTRLLAAGFALLATVCAGETQRANAVVQFPLEVSFINHAVSGPFDGTILDILHPGVSLGTEYTYAVTRYGRLLQSLRGGYYLNEHSARAVFLHTETALRCTVGLGVFGELGLGLGYLHSFHPSPVFALGEGGEYERVADRGKPALTLSASLAVGYDFARRLGWPVSLFVRYQPYVQTPYDRRTSTLSQATLGVGLRARPW